MSQNGQNSDLWDISFIFNGKWQFITWFLFDCVYQKCKPQYKAIGMKHNEKKYISWIIKNIL